MNGTARGSGKRTDIARAGPKRRLTAGGNSHANMKPRGPACRSSETAGRTTGKRKASNGTDPVNAGTTGLTRPSTAGGGSQVQPKLGWTNATMRSGTCRADSRVLNISVGTPKKSWIRAAGNTASVRTLAVTFRSSTRYNGNPERRTSRGLDNSESARRRATRHPSFKVDNGKPGRSDCNKTVPTSGSPDRHHGNAKSARNARNTRNEAGTATTANAPRRNSPGKGSEIQKHLPGARLG